MKLKKKTVLSSWTDFDFSILFLLSNIHKRNPKWKARERTAYKENSEDKMVAENTK
jgi:hypothetical protein